MAKSKSNFICQNCGASYPKWQGQCAQCGEWNSLVEEMESPKKASTMKKKWAEADLKQFVTKRPDVKAVRASKKRFSSTIHELDRVLGGGIVPGSVVLIGGEPGIGKSTLLTQMVLGLAVSKNERQINSSSAANKTNSKKETSKNSKKDDKNKKQKTKTANSKKNSKIPQIYYVSGEESPSQINLRINRIINNEQFIDSADFGKDAEQVSGFIDKSLHFVTSTDVDQLTSLINSRHPDLVVVDSIQTLSTQDLTGASGSIGQVRECTDRLRTTAKRNNVPLFLVGHVTKKGTIAGPKTLEHIVDTVLQLSGERTGQFRMLRALKNRFGATDEVGVFQFVDFGLKEITNPSQIFLENQQDVPGSAITCVIEGTRPLLIEVQALANKSHLAMPLRVGRGIQMTRIRVLTAVLQKYCGLPVNDNDIFLSAAGGFEIKEPAVDLGLAMAIASSLKEQRLPKKTVFVGEVGLLGEIRPVTYLERRIKEAKRLGYEKIISSKTHSKLQPLIKKMLD